MNSPKKILHVFIMTVALLFFIIVFLGYCKLFYTFTTIDEKLFIFGFLIACIVLSYIVAVLWPHVFNLIKSLAIYVSDLGCGAFIFLMNAIFCLGAYMDSLKLLIGGEIILFTLGILGDKWKKK